MVYYETQSCSECFYTLTNHWPSVTDMCSTKTMHWHKQGQYALSTWHLVGKSIEIRIDRVARPWCYSIHNWITVFFVLVWLDVRVTQTWLFCLFNYSVMKTKHHYKGIWTFIHVCWIQYLVRTFDTKLPCVHRQRNTFIRLLILNL